MEITNKLMISKLNDVFSPIVSSYMAGIIPKIVVGVERFKQTTNVSRKEGIINNNDIHIIGEILGIVERNQAYLEELRNGAIPKKIDNLIDSGVTMYDDFNPYYLGKYEDIFRLNGGILNKTKDMDDKEILTLSLDKLKGYFNNDWRLNLFDRVPNAFLAIHIRRCRLIHGWMSDWLRGKTSPESDRRYINIWLEGVKHLLNSYHNGRLGDCSDSITVLFEDMMIGKHDDGRHMNLNADDDRYNLMLKTSLVFNIYQIDYIENTIFADYKANPFNMTNLIESTAAMEELEEESEVPIDPLLQKFKYSIENKHSAEKLCEITRRLIDMDITSVQEYAEHLPKLEIMYKHLNDAYTRPYPELVTTSDSLYDLNKAQTELGYQIGLVASKL